MPALPGRVAPAWIPPSSGGGGGGVTVHNLLSGRSENNAHPMSAITGLLAAFGADQDLLDDLAAELTALGVDIDALQLAPPLHAVSHAFGQPDAVTITLAQVTGLVGALAGKATPAEIAQAIVDHIAAVDPHGDRAYALSLFAANDALVYKGVIDCSGNPNYPAADAGHTYRISVAGKLGGASGVVVEAGDLALCVVDGSAAGTQAAVGANWDIVQTNLGPLATVATTGAYADLSGKPTLGTAAATAATDYLPVNNPTATGVLTGPRVAASGVTGTTIPNSLGGGTASGAPTTGAHLAGEISADALGILWFCTVAGTPGTWVQASGSGRELGYAEITSNSAGFTGVAIANRTDVAGLTISITVAARPIAIHIFAPTVTGDTTSRTIGLAIVEGTTVISQATVPITAANQVQPMNVWGRVAPSAGAHTYKVMAWNGVGAATGIVNASTTGPAFIRAVEV